MSKADDALKAQMIKDIQAGGAWFSTREDNYLKIGKSDKDNCLFARVCVLEDGSLRGKAYTFGTDWFDISMHGRRIDIYVDPDTLRSWDIRHDADKGTYFAPDSRGGEGSQRLLAFSTQADKEALEGGLRPYHIHGAGFAEDLQQAQESSRKLGDILRKAAENGSLDNLK